MTNSGTSFLRPVGYLAIRIKFGLKLKPGLRDSAMYNGLHSHEQSVLLCSSHPKKQGHSVVCIAILPVSVGYIGVDTRCRLSYRNCFKREK